LYQEAKKKQEDENLKVYAKIHNMVEARKFITFDKGFTVSRRTSADGLPNHRQTEKIVHAPLSFPLSEEYDSSVRELVPKIIEAADQEGIKLSDRDLTVLLFGADYVGVENPDEFREPKTIYEMQKRLKKPESWVDFYLKEFYEDERLLPVFEALIPNPVIKPKTHRIHAQPETHQEVYQLIALARKSGKSYRTIIQEIKSRHGIKIGRTQVIRIAKEVKEKDKAG